MTNEGRGTARGRASGSAVIITMNPAPLPLRTLNRSSTPPLLGREVELAAKEDEVHQ